MPCLGEQRNHAAVRVHADIDEGTEVGDVGHRALEDHAVPEILPVLDHPVQPAGDLLAVADYERNRRPLISINQCLTLNLDWALYSVFLRWRPPEMAPATFLGAIVAIGLLPLAVLYAWDFGTGQGFAINLVNLGAIGYVALFPSVLAYFFWNRAVAEMGPNRTGQYLHLMPVFGAALAILLLGERLQSFHFAGALLIAAGIVLATLGKKPG